MKWRRGKEKPRRKGMVGDTGSSPEMKLALLLRMEMKLLFFTAALRAKGLRVLLCRQNNLSLLRQVWICLQKSGGSLSAAARLETIFLLSFC